MCSAHTRVNPSILAEFPNEYVPSLHEFLFWTWKLLSYIFAIVHTLFVCSLQTKNIGLYTFGRIRKSWLDPVAVGLPILGVTASPQTSVALFQKLDFLNSGLIWIEYQPSTLSKTSWTTPCLRRNPWGHFTTPWGFLWQMEAQCQSGRLHCIGCKGSLVWQ